MIGDIDGVVVRDLKIVRDRRGWLAELFRRDELEERLYPAMAYISSTGPGIRRGPHEHVDQADCFASSARRIFKIRMRDNRAGSETFNHVMTLIVGQDNPKSVLVPGGVVHAYQNVAGIDGTVINCPNRLYAGQTRKS